MQFLGHRNDRWDFAETNNEVAKKNRVGNVIWQAIKHAPKLCQIGFSCCTKKANAKKIYFANSVMLRCRCVCLKNFTPSPVRLPIFAKTP